MCGSNCVHCGLKVVFVCFHITLSHYNYVGLSERIEHTVYPKKYAHGFCFAVLCCGYTLTDFPISIRFTSLALWQSNDCPSASKATLMNMDKYFMWIHYERLNNHNKAKHNKTVCIFLGIYCMTCWSGTFWLKIEPILSTILRAIYGTVFFNLPRCLLRIWKYAYSISLISLNRKYESPAIVWG